MDSYTPYPHTDFEVFRIVNDKEWKRWCRLIKIKGMYQLHARSKNGYSPIRQALFRTETEGKEWAQQRYEIDGRVK